MRGHHSLFLLAQATVLWPPGGLRAGTELRTGILTLRRYGTDRRSGRLTVTHLLPRMGYRSRDYAAPRASCRGRSRMSRTDAIQPDSIQPDTFQPDIKE